jgi:hypothetical protein
MNKFQIEVVKVVKMGEDKSAFKIITYRKETYKEGLSIDGRAILEVDLEEVGEIMRN